MGFPGETEAEFEQLLDFLEEAQLDRVGCFAYSPVEGAAANALPDPVPEEIKEERRARFMAVQEKISRARLSRKIGKRMTVLVDEVEKNRAIARSSADAPEIDGIVYIGSPKNLKAGEFAEVEVIGSDTHDLQGKSYNTLTRRCLSGGFAARDPHRAHVIYLQGTVTCKEMLSTAVTLRNSND